MISRESSFNPDDSLFVCQPSTMKNGEWALDRATGISYKYLGRLNEGHRIGRAITA